MSVISSNVVIFLAYLNYFVLSFYILRTLYILYQHGNEVMNRPMPALGIVYATGAAVWIWRSIQNIDVFGITGIEITNMLPPSYVHPVLILIVFAAGGLISSAFLVNGSRALFILNKLEVEKTSISKSSHKFIEFLLRTLCAGAFFILEFFLSANFNNCMIGFAGCVLYISLLLWWYFNTKILMHTGFDKSYRNVFFCGILVSVFMFSFGEIPDHWDRELVVVLFLLTLAIPIISASVMVFVISKDSVSSFFHLFKKQPQT